jgi:ComEC/Rec2-related protein
MTLQRTIKANKLPTSFLLLIASTLGCFFRIYYTNNQFMLKAIFASLFIIFTAIIFINNKNKIIKIILLLTSTATMFLMTNIWIKTNSNTLQKILARKNLYGKIIEADKKNYSNFYTVSIKSNLLINQKTNIKIISKNKITLGKDVYIKRIYWISKSPKNENEIINQIRSTKTLAAGISNNIIEINSKKNILEKTISYMLELKEKIISDTKKLLDTDLQEIYLSIFLGKGNCTRKSTLEKFRKWGIIHLVARSGLHTGIIGGISQLLILSITKSIFFSTIVGILFLIIFSIISFTSIPFKRAILMFVIHKMCVYKKIKTSFLDIFSKCTIFFIFTDPLIVINIGFQLSFMATGILALMNHYKKIKYY